MISREEMIKLLADEYGIHNDKELNDALEAVSIDVSVFNKEVEDEQRVV